MTWQLRRLLDEDAYGVRYLRFDGPIHPCVSASHGHRMALVPGDTLLHRIQPATLGYYQMLDELREEFPEVTFESSWPLGQVATGEDGDPAAMLPRISRYSMESMRCAVPPQYTGCFLHGEPDVTGLVPVEQAAVRRHYARTPMLGPYTISCDVTLWSSEFSATVAEAIDYYQANRRFLQGDVYNVLTQRRFCGSSPSGCANSWDAVEFLDPDEGGARVFVFRNESEDEDQTLGLKGFVPMQEYEISGVDHGSYGSCTADVDGRIAVSVTLQYENSSEILEIE